ncbi:hypothetical protein D6856_03820 [Butyrivibrio sp. XB500-5]|uniref:histidine phosphatase family protein n=1 Tax=Butyrivibrio sp. XB500-5 TaxID=2364880 RepID=UPI000EA9DFA1|nr:histidine phosphatase family protein [Butyrivibrio sp. XB500-5]RKM63259.1 hypothetical protein D6856_03820 [Butyrivibrio sp. XB500-5]
MKVVIIRHGVVDYKMNLRCNSEEFDQDVKKYDEAPILTMEYNVPAGDYKSYYVSSLSRTLATARDIFGDKEYISTELLDEVPLSSSIKTNKRLPLAFWKISSRLQWLFNSKRPKEGKKDTVIRANKFIDDIIVKNEDCAVVSHGFFMITLFSEMKKRGFMIQGKAAGYENGEYVICEK